MNILKGSLFRRNTEPEELEPMEESGGGILAVWGSPGCGKTVTAVKIAKHLAAQKKNTVLLLCDMTAPMMPCICAPSELEVDKSLGSIFAAQHISVNLIKHNLTTLKRLPHLTMLGLRKKENEYTYAPCTKQQAEELIRGLREIVPYLDGRVGYKESIQRANNSAASFRHWVHLYKGNGAAGLLPNSRNKVYLEDTKWKAVQEYLSGHGSLESVCEKYEIRSTSQLRSWIKVYHAHGDFNSVKFSGGGSYMKQGRSTTQEERVQIVKDCLASGKNYGEMALKYKVSYQQVRTWTLRFEEMGESGLEDRRGKRKKDQVPRTELEKAQIEIEQLKHKLYLAEMERDLLKKLDEIERRDAFRK